MIDRFSTAFTAVATALHTAYSTMLVHWKAPASMTQFPAAILQQTDNYEIARDLSNVENAAVIGLQVDIYSNLDTGNLTQRQAIAAIIDTTLRGLKYHRTFYNTNMPNIEVTIERSTMRYEGIAV